MATKRRRPRVRESAPPRSWERAADLTLKYRPNSLDEIHGHSEVCASIQDVIERGGSHAFLFTGPSGVGKTTLARIVASMVGCDPVNVMEIDAATHSGVDAMRRVTENLAFRAVQGSPMRMIVVDECHALSKAAWQSLLKSLEEPPSHVWWCLCTTEASKIPDTIRTRCTSYVLGKVHRNEIFELLMFVVDQEQGDVSEDVLDLCASKADGSPRQALSYLAACWQCSTRADAVKLIKSLDTADNEVIAKFCRALGSTDDWGRIRGALQAVLDEGMDAESVRRIVINWFSKVIMGAKTSAKAANAAVVLDAFADPYPQGSGPEMVILSTLRVIGD